MPAEAVVVREMRDHGTYLTQHRGHAGLEAELAFEGERASATSGTWRVAVDALSFEPAVRPGFVLQVLDRKGGAWTGRAVERDGTHWIITADRRL